MSNLSSDFRKFQSKDYYQNKIEIYYLLTFKFHKINQKKEVIVNEFGDYMIADNGTANKIVNREINKESRLYADLIAKFFISEKSKLTNDSIIISVLLFDWSIILWKITWE